MEGDAFQLAKLAIIPETTNLFGKNFQKQMLLIKRKLDQTVVATSLNLKQERCGVSQWLLLFITVSIRKFQNCSLCTP